MSKSSDQQTWRLYTACAWCGRKMNAAEKRMSCRDCPKRPKPIEQYTDGLYDVNVYPPANGGGVGFSVTSDFLDNGLFRGVAL